MTAELEMESSDERFQEWMRGNLYHAAGHFGLAVCAEPVFGWRLRTIGAPATGLGGPRWLRVVSEYRGGPAVTGGPGTPTRMS